MEACLLPTVLNMLADVPRSCPIIKDLIVDVLAGLVLKGLPYLHLSLWLLRDVCCTYRVLFLSLSGQWQWQLEHQCQRLPAILEGKGQVDVASDGVPNNAISALKLANFLVHFLGLAWVAEQLVFIILLFLFFFRISLSSQSFQSSCHL